MEMISYRPISPGEEIVISCTCSSLPDSRSEADTDRHPSRPTTFGPPPVSPAELSLHLSLRPLHFHVR